MNPSKTYRKVLGALIAFIAAALAAPIQAQTPFEPAAVVNDEVITRFDLDQRLRAEVALNGTEINRETANRILGDLVSDTLRLQAARRAGIDLPAEQVTAGISSFAGSRNLTREQLLERLASTGATEQPIRDLIESEIAWQELIRRRYGSRARATEADVARELELLDADVGAAENIALRLYELGFLSIAASANASIQEVNDATVRLSTVRGEIDNCSALAERAGEFGPGSGVRANISLSALPAPLREAIQPLITGQFTDPVRLTNGVVLALVCSIQTEDANAQQIEEIRRRLVQRNFERYSDAFLQELRRDAVIEIR